MPDNVTLRDRDGQSYGVPQDQAAAYLAQGFRLEGDEEHVERLGSEVQQGLYGGPVGAAESFGVGALSGLTLGASDLGIEALGGGGALRGLSAQHGIAGGAGTLIGAIAPTILTGGAAAPEEAASIGARILAHSPAGLVSKVGGGVTHLGEGAGLVGRAVAGTAGAAAEGALYGGGQYLTESALQDKPLSAEGFVAGMGHGALFAAPIGAAGTLASATLQRARSLFPRSEVSAAAAAGVKAQATSSLAQAVRDGDEMAAAAERKLSDVEAKAQMAQAGESVTRRVFGGADPQALGDQVVGAVDRQQVTQALQGYQQARQGLEDWIASEADPELERALQGNPTFRDAFGKLGSGQPALDKMLASTGPDDLETMLGQVGGAAPGDPRLEKAMRATVDRPDVVGVGGLPVGEFGAPGARGIKTPDELARIAEGSAGDGAAPALEQPGTRQLRGGARGTPVEPAPVPAQEIVQRGIADDGTVAGRRTPALGSIAADDPLSIRSLKPEELQHELDFLDENPGVLESDTRRDAVLQRMRELNMEPAVRTPRPVEPPIPSVAYATPGATSNVGAASVGARASGPSVAETTTPRFTKTDRAAGGSQGGAWYRDESGQQWFGKRYSGSADRMENEHVANQIYRIMGVDVPETKIVEVDGKRTLMSKEIQGRLAGQAGDLHGTNIGDGFVVDAWLSNNDVAGLSFDNLIVSGDKAHRIDNGGALAFRAQGELRKFAAPVHDLESMRDPKFSSGQAFKHLSKEEVDRQLVQFADNYEHSKAAIFKAVDEANISRPIKATIRKGLQSRAEWLEEQADRVRPAAMPVSDSEFEALARSERAKLEHADPGAFQTLLGYSGNGLYGPINNGLREGGEVLGAGKVGYVSPQVAAHIAALDRGIAQSPAPRRMLVYRGVNGEVSARSGRKAVQDLKAGDTWIEHGFMSTSASERIGREYAKGFNVREGGELHITVPQGFPAAPIPSQFSSEQEILLPRGTKFRVQSVTRSDAGHPIISVEASLPEPATPPVVIPKGFDLAGKDSRGQEFFVKDPSVIEVTSADQLPRYEAKEIDTLLAAKHYAWVVRPSMLGDVPLFANPGAIGDDAIAGAFKGLESGEGMPAVELRAIRGAATDDGGNEFGGYAVGDGSDRLLAAAKDDRPILVRFDKGYSRSEDVEISARVRATAPAAGAVPSPAAPVAESVERHPLDIKRAQEAKSGWSPQREPAREARELASEAEFRHAQSEFRAKLDQGEIKQALRFSREYYMDVNRALRGDRAPLDPGAAAEITPVMDGILAKSGIDAPIVTHRAVHFDPGTPQYDLKPGDVLHDKGFGSTAWRSDNIHRFGNVHLVIESPTGTRIAPIPSSASEGEFTLARGTSMKITGREVHPDGNVTLQARVIAQDGNPALSSTAHGQPAATDTLTGQLRSTAAKLSAGESLVEMGAPARAEYRAAKAERTTEAAKHFRAKTLAARGEATTTFDAKDLDLRFDPESRTYHPTKAPMKSGESPDAPWNEGFGAGHTTPEESNMAAEERAAQAEHQAGIRERQAQRDRPSLAAPQSQSLGARIVRDGEAGVGAADPLAQFGLESAPTQGGALAGEVPDEVKAMMLPERTRVDTGIKPRMQGVADEAAIAKAIMRHNGKGTNMGPSLARAAKAIGDMEDASAKLTDLLGNEAPRTAVDNAKAFRTATGHANERAAASSAKAAADLTGKVPAADSTLVDDDIAKALRRHDMQSAAKPPKRPTGGAPATPAAPMTSGIGGKLADAGAALEVLRAIGAHVPAISHIPVIGPILGLWLKARAVMGILGRKGGSIGKSTEGVIAAKAAATRDRIVAATGSILDGAAKGAGKVGHLAGPAVLLAGKLFPGGSKPASDKPRDLYAARMDEIARAQSPGAVDQAIAQRYPTSDPELHDALVAQVQRGIAFLDGKAPKQTMLPGVLPGDGAWKPSMAAIEEFGKYVHAVNDPVSVLEDLAKGHVYAEGAETLRTVYPQLYQYAQKELLQAAPEMAKTLTYPRRVMISILYGIPVDGTLNPSHAQYLQIPSPPPAPSAPTSSGPLRLGQQVMSPLDHRAAGV